MPFRQSTGFGQVFWAAREWLVASATAERLRVDRPFEENLKAARIDLTARFSSQLTVGVGARVQRDALTGRLSRSIIIQLAAKTVH